MRISDWSSDVCSSDLVVLDDGADGIADDMEGMLAVVVVGADTLDDQVLEGPVGRDDMEALEQREAQPYRAKGRGAHDDGKVGQARPGGLDAGAGKFVSAGLKLDHRAQIGRAHV